MIKKVINTILIVLMILGLAFSISNFIIADTVKAAVGQRGVWVDLGGVDECTGDGSECEIGLEERV